MKMTEVINYVIAAVFGELPLALPVLLKRGLGRSRVNSKVLGNFILFNRPGVAGAVLQSPPLLINYSLIHGLWKYLQSNVNPKP